MFYLYVGLLTILVVMFDDINSSIYFWLLSISKRLTVLTHQSMDNTVGTKDLVNTNHNDISSEYR